MNTFHIQFWLILTKFKIICDHLIALKQYLIFVERCLKRGFYRLFLLPILA